MGSGWQPASPSHLRSLGRDFRAFPGQMPVARSHAVIDSDFAPATGRFWSSAEVELHRLPRIARFRLEAETGGRLVTAMCHAVLAARIFGHAINHAVLAPVHLGEELGVAAEMTGAVSPGRVGHEI